MSALSDFIDLSAAAGGSGGKTPKIQKFTSSGTWTRPAGVDVVDIILVAGGESGAGSGGSSGRSGGGGAGGDVILGTYELGAGDLTVTIGAGGVAPAGSYAVNTNGGNSTLTGALTLTAFGGGVIGCKQNRGFSSNSLTYAAGNGGGAGGSARLIYGYGAYPVSTSGVSNLGTNSADMDTTSSTAYHTGFAGPGVTEHGYGCGGAGGRHASIGARGGNIPAKDGSVGATTSAKAKKGTAYGGGGGGGTGSAGITQDGTGGVDGYFEIRWVE